MTPNKSGHSPDKSVRWMFCSRCKIMNFLVPSTHTRRPGGMRQVHTNLLKTSRPVGHVKRHARISGTRCPSCSLTSKRLKRHERSSGTSPGTALGDTWKWTLPTLDGVNGLYHRSRLMPTTAQGPASSRCQRWEAESCSERLQWFPTWGGSRHVKYLFISSGC